MRAMKNYIHIHLAHAVIVCVCAYNGIFPSDPKKPSNCFAARLYAFAEFYAEFIYLRLFFPFLLLCLISDIFNVGVYFCAKIFVFFYISFVLVIASSIAMFVYVS